MAVEFKSLKVGEILYDCSKETLGNTTIKKLGVRTVKILEINQEAGKALVSWNNNLPQWRYVSYFQAANIRRNPPEWIPRVGVEPHCFLCKAPQSQGHTPGCTHPKAKSSARSKKSKVLPTVSS